MASAQPGSQVSTGTIGETRPGEKTPSTPTGLDTPFLSPSELFCPMWQLSATKWQLYLMLSELAYCSGTSRQWGLGAGRAVSTTQRQEWGPALDSLVKRFSPPPQGALGRASCSLLSLSPKHPHNKTGVGMQGLLLSQELGTGARSQPGGQEKDQESRWGHGNETR